MVPRASGDSSCRQSLRLKGDMEVLGLGGGYCTHVPRSGGLCWFWVAAGPSLESGGLLLRGVVRLV